MKPEITVEIEALELRGFNSFDANLFSASLNHELTRLIAQQPPQAGIWRVSAVSINAPREANVVSVGMQVAQAIHTQMLGGGE